MDSTTCGKCQACASGKPCATRRFSQDGLTRAEQALRGSARFPGATPAQGPSVPEEPYGPWPWQPNGAAPGFAGAPAQPRDPYYQAPGIPNFPANAPDRRVTVDKVTDPRFDALVNGADPNPAQPILAQLLGGAPIQGTLLDPRTPAQAQHPSLQTSLVQAQGQNATPGFVGQVFQPSTAAPAGPLAAPTVAQPAPMGSMAVPGDAPAQLAPLAPAPQVQPSPQFAPPGSSKFVTSPGVQPAPAPPGSKFVTSPGVQPAPQGQPQLQAFAPTVGAPTQAQGQLGARPSFSNARPVATSKPVAQNPSPQAQPPGAAPPAQPQGAAPSAPAKTALKGAIPPAGSAAFDALVDHLARQVRPAGATAIEDKRNRRRVRAAGATAIERPDAVAWLAATGMSCEAWTAMSRGARERAIAQIAGKRKTALHATAIAAMVADADAHCAARLGAAAPAGAAGASDLELLPDRAGTGCGVPELSLPDGPTRAYGPAGDAASGSRTLWIVGAAALTLGIGAYAMGHAGPRANPVEQVSRGARRALAAARRHARALARDARRALHHPHGHGA